MITTKRILVLSWLMLGASIIGWAQNIIIIGTNFQTATFSDLEQIDFSNIQFPIENTTVTYELEFVNTTYQDQNITISLDDPLIHFLVVSYFHPDNGWEVIEKRGLNFEWNNQSKTNLNFRCNTNLGVTRYPQKFRISVGSKNHQNNVELRISNTKHFSKTASRRMYLLGMYFGLFLIIIVYTLFSFFSLKKAFFMWFSLFVFFIGVKVSIKTGVLTYFINGLSNHLVFEISTIVSTLIFISFIRFLQLFLNVKERFPKLNKVLIIVVVLRVIVNLLFIAVPNLNLDTVIIHSRSGLLIALFIGLYVSIKSRHTQKGFTIAILGAFSFLIFTGLLGSFLDLQMLVFNLYNVNGWLVTNLTQVLLFLVAISIQLNGLANERIALGEKMREAKKSLIQAYVTGVKTEKEHISKELEFLVLEGFNTIKSSIKNESLKQELNKIESDIRDISDELKHNAEISKSFIDEVTGLVNNHQTPKLEIIFSSENFKIELSPSIAKHLLRIIQESIQNIEKYANASVVNIELKQEENRLNLSIKDNGVGFDSSQKSGGLGLTNMRTRVEKMNGEIKIITTVGKGVSIRIDIPI